MSGLIGLADSLIHKIKHDGHHDDTSKANEDLLDGGIGGFGSAANGALTGRSMGGGLYGQICGEKQMEPTPMEKGEGEPNTTT